MLARGLKLPLRQRRLGPVQKRHALSRTSPTWLSKVIAFHKAAPRLVVPPTCMRKAQILSPRPGRRQANRSRRRCSAIERDSASPRREHVNDAHVAQNALLQQFQPTLLAIALALQTAQRLFPFALLKCEKAGGEQARPVARAGEGPGPTPSCARPGRGRRANRHAAPRHARSSNSSASVAAVI